MTRIAIFAAALIIAGCGREPAAGGNESEAAAAHSACAVTENGEIAVADAWVRATAGAGMSAAYFSLCNQSNNEDSLIGVETGIGVAELHETIRSEDGVVSMSPRDRFDLAGGEQLSFEPGGAHVMLMGLQEPIAEGSSVMLVLQFESGKRIETEATARAPGDSAPGDTHSH